MTQTVIANLLVFGPGILLAAAGMVTEATREIRNSPKAILARQGRRR